VGLVLGNVGKTILRLAGIDDVWSQTRGQTQTTINFAGAVFTALKHLSTVKANKSDLENLGVECTY
jgi:small subunit ribosomal protein S5